MSVDPAVIGLSPNSYIFILQDQCGVGIAFFDFSFGYFSNFYIVDIYFVGPFADPDCKVHFFGISVGVKGGFKSHPLARGGFASGESVDGLLALADHIQPAAQIEVFDAFFHKIPNTESVFFTCLDRQVADIQVVHTVFAGSQKQRIFAIKNFLALDNGGNGAFGGGNAFTVFAHQIAYAHRGITFLLKIPGWIKLFGTQSQRSCRGSPDQNGLDFHNRLLLFLYIITVVKSKKAIQNLYLKLLIGNLRLFFTFADDDIILFCLVVKRQQLFGF